MGILWYNPLNTPPDLELGSPVKVSPAGVFFAIRSRPNRITVGKHPPRSFGQAFLGAGSDAGSTRTA